MFHIFVQVVSYSRETELHGGLVMPKSG